MPNHRRPPAIKPATVLASLAALVLAATLGALAVSSPSAAGTTVVTMDGFYCTRTTHDNGGFTLVCDPTAPTPSPTTPTPSPTMTVSPTASPTPTPSPSTSTTPPPAAGFPTVDTTGTPAGWKPKSTFNGTMTIRLPGVYEDIRVNGGIDVRATGVTLRRIEVIGGIIDNENGGRCYNGLVIEDTTVRNVDVSSGAIQPGGYTARRVELNNVTEGFRVGGRSDAGCGPTLIEDSLARVVPPAGCGDWHGDGLQGYDAPPLTIRHSTLILVQDECSGTSAYFYPAGEQPAVIDGLLVQGGGYVFRSDSPVSVKGLRIVNGSWYYGPIETDVTCRRVTSWVDNAISDDLGNVIRLLPTCASA